MAALSNPKYEAFARSVAAGMDATEAYEKAGFKRHRGNASRLRTSENVVRRIAELSEKATERVIASTAMTREWVLGMLRRNVEMAMQAQPVLDSRGEPTGEYRVNGAVANKALELIGRELHGMFAERRELTGRNGGPIETKELSDEQLEAFIARLAAEG